MGEDQRDSSMASSIELNKLVRSIHFAFVCLPLGLAYFNIQGSMLIPTFKNIFSDMLDGAQLPLVSFLVLKGYLALFILSICIPLVALASLLRRTSGKSFYVIGALTLVSFVQIALVFHALPSPLVLLMDQLGKQ